MLALFKNKWVLGGLFWLFGVKSSYDNTIDYLDPYDENYNPDAPPPQSPIERILKIIQQNLFIVVIGLYIYNQRK